MKLDVNVLRYLSKDDFRVLTAVEMGQKNHEIVPAQLVDSIAGLKHGGTFKCLRNLLRHKLVHHDSSKYDGYRLTYMGYDFLAIKALVNRGAISGVGRQIGVGKESDIFEVTNEEGEVMALKLHRLGRTSFRAVKSKRDYMKRGSHYSWLYLSRLAALKEFAFMRALGDHGLPVPQARASNAIDNSRHAVLMSLVDSYPLVQVKELSSPRRVYTQLMDLLCQLAGLGLVHCDFNEFNLLINDTEELTLIDFPQMVSELFERDVECIIRFFSKKLGYIPELDEGLERVRPSFQDAVAAALGSIDGELRASGFKKEHQSVLERFVESRQQGEEEDVGEEEEEDEGEGSDSSEGSEEQEEQEGSEAGAAAWAGNEGEGEGDDAGAQRQAARAAGGGDGLAALAEEGSQGKGGLLGSETSSSDAGARALGSDEEEKEEGSEGEAAAAGMAGLRLGGRAPRRPGTAAARQQQHGGGGGSGAQQRVQAALAGQQRRAARRDALAKASSRNASKAKNKGKRKGASGGLGDF
eukprot:scaffold8.g1718.t1